MQPHAPDNFIKKLILRSIKLPSLLFLVGIAFVTLSYFEQFSTDIEWKNLFSITDEIGNILLALAAVMFLYKFAVSLCTYYEMQFLETHKILALILTRIKKDLRIIFILIAFNVVASMTEATYYYPNLAIVIRSLIIIVISWIIIRILYTTEVVLYQFTQTASTKDYLRTKSWYTRMRIIRNIATTLIITIAIAAILMNFNSFRNIGISLLASAGFLTAVIGLAAQKTLSSLFYGMQIGLSQSIKIGDSIVIEGQSGSVEEITLTYIALMLSDKRRLVVPINYFIEKPFENWSQEGNSLRGSVYMYIDYKMPIETLRKAGEEILRNSIYWDKSAYKLEIIKFTEFTPKICIHLSASNADSLGELQAEVREKMLTFIQDNYPQYLPPRK